MATTAATDSAWKARIAVIATGAATGRGPDATSAGVCGIVGVVNGFDVVGVMNRSWLEPNDPVGVVRTEVGAAVPTRTTFGRVRAGAVASTSLLEWHRRGVTAKGSTP